MLLGFDIGGTKCAIVLGKAFEASDKIEIAGKAVIPTEGPANDMIEKMFTAAEGLIAGHGFKKNDVDGIGISCGGPLDSKRGIILSPPNLLGWDHIPIVELTKKRFGKNTSLQNDANACALAEWRYGAGRGFNNLIFLTFGTGMGAGLILNGQLYAGASDLAGEVGHLRIADMGPVGFGKAGSFEGFCSGGGIAQLARMKVLERLQVGKEVSFCKNIHKVPTITAKSVAEAAYAGDELAVEIYAICAKYLGIGVSLLIDILNPEIIIIGSIYGRARSLLEPGMAKIIAQETYFGSRSACQIVPAGLSEQIGDMAALTLAYQISVA